MAPVALVIASLIAGSNPASEAASEPASQPSLQPASQPASAPDFDVFNIFEEQQMVVTGAAKATRLRESPTSVWVIDETTLRHQPMLTLYDALRTVPGINIIEYTLGHGEANLRFIGSFPEHQSLTLIDGRPAASDSLGYFDYSLVDRRNVEKIEIVLGPSSTLYGANAFNGVVNIVTKKPMLSGHHLELAIDSGFTTGNLGVSRFEPYRFGALVTGHAAYGAGWGSGGFRLSASGMFAQSGGAQAIYTPHIIDTPVRQGTATLDVLQNVGKFVTRLQVGMALKKSPYLFLDLDDAAQQDYYANLSISRTAIAGADDKLSIDVWAKHNRLEFATLFAGRESIPLAMFTTSMEGRLAYTVPTFYENTLTVGAQARGIFVELGAGPGNVQLGEPGKRQLLAGVFVEDMYRPLPQLLLTAGVRVDTREMAATRAFRYLSVSPRASIVWLVNDDHSLRLEYASAFRTPTAVERALVVTSSAGEPIVLGGLDLRNERIHSVTLAYLGRIKWFSMRLELYIARTLDNIIPVLEATATDRFEVNGQPLYIASPDSLFKYPFYYYNAVGFPVIPGAAIKLGFEPTSSWRMYLTYMLMPSPLTHRAGAVTEWTPIPRLTLAAQLFFYGAVKTAFFQYPMRFILNASIAYQLDPTGAWTMSLNVLNALDLRVPVPLAAGSVQTYRESISGGRVGPRAWLSVAYAF